jgi:hypothetical protein
METIREALSASFLSVDLLLFVHREEANKVAVDRDRLRHQRRDCPIIGLGDGPIDQPECVQSGDILCPELWFLPLLVLHMDIGVLSSNERVPGVGRKDVILGLRVLASIVPAPEGADDEDEGDGCRDELVLPTTPRTSISA